MQIEIALGDQSLTLDVPTDVAQGAESLFATMDADMDGGWQMSRRYVENPDTVQRCQIAADRLLTSLHTGNKEVTLMMAGYIVNRIPDVRRIEIDVDGEVFNTRFTLGSGRVLTDGDQFP